VKAEFLQDAWHKYMGARLALPCDLRSGEAIVFNVGEPVWAEAQIVHTNRLRKGSSDCYTKYRSSLCPMAGLIASTTRCQGEPIQRVSQTPSNRSMMGSSGLSLEKTAQAKESSGDSGSSLRSPSVRLLTPNLTEGDNETMFIHGVSISGRHARCPRMV
jgi:hypothetical protein